VHPKIDDFEARRLARLGLVTTAQMTNGSVTELLVRPRRSEGVMDPRVQRLLDDAFAALRAGDLVTGFRLWELLPRARWPGPQWTGQPLSGETVLLFGGEGGFGDDIQFCRYAPLVADRSAKVIIVVPPELSRLFSTLPGVDRIIAAEISPGVVRATALIEPLCYRYQTTLPSLPFAFGTTLKTIPADVPYLHGDPTPWRSFLGPAGK
jgi:hypothetical protein